MGAWLIRLMAFIPHSWIKSALIKGVEAEAPVIKKRLELAFEEKGPQAMDDAVTATERRLVAGIDTVGPAWPWLHPMRIQLHDLIRLHMDSLRATLKIAVAQEGIKAIDKVVDEGTALLVAKIQTL